MQYLLFPGRHHLLTRFQSAYLREVLSGASAVYDIDGQQILGMEKIERVVFAITSANHAFTRRNPLPLHLRAMAIQEFALDIPAETYVCDIDDVGTLPDFASYTIKRIHNRTDGCIQIQPHNTIVLCSTPSVLAMYRNLGFRILPCELSDQETEKYTDALPWEVVESVASSPLPLGEQPVFNEKAHAASVRIWQTYDLGRVVRQLFADGVIGDDGDITETRDYNAYVRGMDDVTQLKFRETVGFIQPGRIGDIGCAAGSWIKQASREPRLGESEFYGVEVSRKLFDLCEQRKGHGEFPNPYTFFVRKNAITGSVFEEASMHTIHTSALTHEIYSYADTHDVDALIQADASISTASAFQEVGRRQLAAFIAHRAGELRPGGVWINRDVIGPEEGCTEVLVSLDRTDGRCDDFEKVFDPQDREGLKTYLSGLSTYAKFMRFATDYRGEEGGNVCFEEEEVEHETYLRLSLRDIWEFATKKDYPDNWMSEMHESFCFWSFSEWRHAIEAAGLTVNPSSHAFLNPWIAEHRLKEAIQLFRRDEAGGLKSLAYPPTTMILIAQKP